MTTLDGALYLAESEPPFIAKMWEAIQTAEPLEGALSPWPMRRVVATLYEGILHLKALGRTLAQICEFLTEYSGLPITPSTLATYLSREKTRRKGKPQHPRRPVQAPVPSVVPNLGVPEAVVPTPFVELSQEPKSEAVAPEPSTEATSSSVETVADSCEGEGTESVESNLEVAGPEVVGSEVVEPTFSQRFEATASSSESHPSPAPLPYWKRVQPFTRAQTDSSTAATEREQEREQEREREKEKEKRKPAPEPLLNEPEFNHIARLQLPPKG